MRRSFAAVLGGLALTAAVSGCHDFLTGNGISTDPNNPTQATRDQLLVAAITGYTAVQESNVAMYSCIIMQQCAGVGGRFVEAYDTYTILPETFNAEFVQLYTGGGLLDLRKIRQLSRDANDPRYAGAAEVLEALYIAFGADMWGDIPYSETVGDATEPRFDKQADIYDHLQALLDSAITDLAATGESGLGSSDLIFGGDATKWTETAYTLKARLYLHTAECSVSEAGCVNATDGGQPYRPAAYQNAIAAAQHGISDPSHDFKAYFHGGTGAFRNIWQQFQTTSFGQDLVADSVLVDLMKSRNDPRLSAYFTTNGHGQYLGFNQVDPGTTDVSVLKLAPDYPQPLVTWAENQLILAEANYRLNGAAAALPYLNAERTRAGLGALAAGQVTLQSIMEEKYVALFQNIEVWNDYKRTCYPRLTPIGTDEIPGRLYYGATEENANPNTLPAAEQETSGGVAGGSPSVGAFRNPNDPNACPIS